MSASSCLQGTDRASVAQGSDVLARGLLLLLVLLLTLRVDRDSLEPIGQLLVRLHDQIGQFTRHVTVLVVEERRRQPSKDNTTTRLSGFPRNFANAD